jgi:F0F1-type ATP synthase membrane subunit b/b'
MATQEPGRAAPPALAALPRLEDIPLADRGYEPDRVQAAFDSFRRHTAQLQAQLRVLQAAGRSASVEPTGHSVRMDALHLIRSAAEFADTIERDAQNAASSQIARTEEEVRRRQNELQDRQAEIDRYRAESERQRAEIVNSAKAEARELLANSNRDATQELREAEARGARLLEQSRHQATELTNSARAEVEQTLEWARGQATVILQRAQQGAEQLLRAAGMGDEALAEVTDAILRAAEQEAGVELAPRAAEGPAAPALQSVEAEEPGEGEEERPKRSPAAPPPPSFASPPPPPVTPGTAEGAIDSAPEPGDETDAEDEPETDEDGDETRS